MTSIIGHAHWHILPILQRQSEQRKCEHGFAPYSKSPTPPHCAQVWEKLDKAQTLQILASNRQFQLLVYACRG
jgi:hypothetical protein